MVVETETVNGDLKIQATQPFNPPLAGMVVETLPT
jgi:hypothetical protein